MYNIDMYDYNPKPFSFTKKYGIHPLYDKVPRGLEKFLGSDSHNHNYLSRLNPKVFREIVGMDYEAIVAQQEKEIAETKKEGYDKKHKEQPVQALKVKFHQDPMQPDETNPIQEEGNQEHQAQHQEEEKGRREEDFSKQSQYNATRQLNDPMRQTARHYHRKYNFKDIYGYEKPSKANTALGRTMTEINHLKRNKLNNNEFQSSHSNDFYPKKRYDGFTSYAVPRTDEYRTSTNRREGTPFDIYNRTIANVMSASTNRERTKDRNCQTEYETLQFENEKMKEIIKDHTNTNWMQSQNLPSVGTILEKNKKTIRNATIGNSKIMGERYNPFNNYFGSKNRTGRNFTGALFQH